MDKDIVKMDRNTSITLSTYKEVLDSDGQNKVWQKLVQTNFLSPRFYNEYLGQTIQGLNLKPGTKNIEVRNTTLGKIRKNNSDSASGFNDLYNEADNLTEDQKILRLKDEYVQAYKYSSLDMRTFDEWNLLLSEYMRGLGNIRADNKNKLIMQAIVDTCLVYGLFYILPEANGNYGDAENRDWIYREATMRLTGIADDVVNERTAFNLGEDPDLIRILLSFNSYRNLIRGVNYNNASDKSLEAFASGKFERVMGYPVARTSYLDKKFTAADDPVDKTADYYLSNVIGIISSAETILYADIQYPIKNRDVPTMQYDEMEYFGWISQAAVYNSRKTLNRIVLKVKPTEEQCRAALNRLKAQAQFYTNLPSDINSAQIDEWITTRNLDLSFYKPAVEAAKKEAKEKADREKKQKEDSTENK